MEEEVCLEAPLVVNSMDYSGRAAVGSWRSAWFIISVEVAERIAYFGIQGNLVSYLTGPLHQTTATAAKNVNVWTGTTTLLPLFGAFLADSYLGRYRTIIIASIIYILGLASLTLSAIVPSLTNGFQVILFFVSLYLVAMGQAGHKPCVQAFGADQFDEHKDRSTFFNWWYFASCAGCITTVSILNYIQDNLSWVLGFGIPCLLMIIALLIFFLGTESYRFSIPPRPHKTPFLRIGRGFLAAIRNRNLSCTQEISEPFNLLDNELLGTKGNGCVEEAEVEEAKAVLRLVPIWAACLIYGIAHAQIPTLFTKQGATMERTISIFGEFDIPPASLQIFDGLAIVLFTPIYDRKVVPLARSLTGKPLGITMLQRVGTGIFISILNLMFAAFVEAKRLKTAKKFGVVDEPNATVPMSVWWLIPQYFLFGISNVFTMVGLQEFFYDQVPNELRSMGLAFSLSIFGVGNFLSSSLISVTEQLTGKDGWFANNLNKAHIDYFYSLLAGLSVMGLALFVFFAKSYIYKAR